MAVGADQDEVGKLVLDLSCEVQWHAVMDVDVSVAKFAVCQLEVKSLPGPFREFDAAINRALQRGNNPESKTFTAVFRSANDVLASEGRRMIDDALSQLDRKSEAGHSKTSF